MITLMDALIRISLCESLLIHLMLTLENLNVCMLIVHEDSFDFRLVLRPHPKTKACTQDGNEASTSSSERSDLDMSLHSDLETPRSSSATSSLELAALASNTRLLVRVGSEAEVLHCLAGVLRSAE